MVEEEQERRTALELFFRRNWNNPSFLIENKKTQTHPKLELIEFNLLLQLIKFPNNPNHPFCI